MARGERVTFFAAALALGHAWLGRISGSDDALIGSPIAGRHRIETEGVIGFFVSNLVFRAQLPGDPTARELMVRTREETLAILSHQDVPFDLLVEALAPERDLSTTPIYQVQLMAFDALHRADSVANAADEAARHESLGLALSPLTSGEEMSLFDLSLAVAEGGRRLALQYNRDLFDPATAERLVGYVENLMVAFVGTPDRHFSEIGMIGAVERRQLLVDWNPPFERLEDPASATAVAPFRRETLLPEWVAAHAAGRPGSIAVEMGEATLTYAELDARSTALARHLALFGVGAEVRVGLCLERCLDLVVGLIAVQKAGGAYLPLDPTYPLDRLAGMIEDAGLMLLLAHDATLDALPASTAYLINLDRSDEMAAMMGDAGGAATPLPGPAPEHLAYVIYTSGSTGKPKGVMLAHDGLANLCAEQARIFAVGPESRVLQFASVSFDASVAEIAVALCAGATLVMAEREELLPGPDLVRLLSERRITKATIPPSALAVLPPGTESELPDLATLVVAGEACPPELAARWSAGRRFVNAYGPTEATVCASTEVYSAPTALTLGRPLQDVETHVLGRRLEPLPVGVSGELLIGGRGLARGYLNRPDLSAERFVPHPFAAERKEPGARLYRTGDLVRRLADGRIEFLGRIDHQVKVRGYRIELGEVEAALRAQSGVNDVVVLARNDSAVGQAADRLVAYLVAEPERELHSADLKAALAARLPDYMVPAAFVVLPAFPLTTNGKVDRKALPAPELAHLHVEGVRYEAPRDAIEALVAEIFAEVLALAGEISIHDSFFDLGGHSLLATQLLSRVRESFGVEMPLRQVFEAQTVASFARAIEAAQREARGLESGPIERQERVAGVELPLSFAQERLWFLDQLEPGSPTYNIPTALKVRGALDPARLAAALRYLERRHESLRTTFPTRNGRAVQSFSSPDAPRGALLFARVDLSVLAEARREAEVLRLAAAEAIRPFDLATGPLGRVVLVQLAAAPQAEQALLLTVHHIISDGWSMGVFVRELAEVHAALVEGRPVDPAVVPPLPIQYADFAAWQRGWLVGDVLERQMEHWRRHLIGAPELLALPTDRPRPAIQSYRGASVARASATGSVERLQALSRAEGATIFMTLLAAWSTLLYRYTGQADIPVGTPIANRNRAEVEGLIGFFVNTLVLRTKVAPRESFRSLLGSVREATLEGYAHQDLPFEKLVEAIAPQRNLSYSPLFQSMLVLQNNPDRPLELPGLELSGLAMSGEVSKYDLTLNAIELGPRLACRVVYSTALFEPATVERILGHLHVLLEALLDAPDRPVGTLDLFSPEERRTLLFRWNEPAVEHPSDGYLPRMFEAQVDAGPSRIAVEFDRSGQAGADPAAVASLTYAELDERANRLAHYLQKAGVGPEVRVGVCLERSLDLPVALLAVLKAGAAYLPLDPSLPEDRLRYLVEDAAAPVVVTVGRFVERLGAARESAAAAPRLVLLDDEATAEAIAAEPATRLSAQALDDHPAYVIYTSGSTGQPKGVVVSHRALGNRLRYATATDFATDAEAFLQKTTISFDVSVLEIFAPLVSGGRTVLPEPEGHRDPAYLVRLIAARRITQASFPPSTLALLLDSGALDECRDLALLVTGGETVPADLPNRVHERLPRIDLYNRYGPTEATISVTSWLCRPGGAERSLPIGRPTAKAQVYLLDREGEPVPVGVAGELHLGGLCLARGYLGRPVLTAAAFVPDPFGAEPGGRLYATGDLAKWRADGAIDFVGRIDGQIKIRGFRVELGEIEAALHRHEGVREAAVIDREDTPGQKRLVAYVVAEADAPADLLAALRERLAAELPAYMVPAAFVPLEVLPLSPTGKVDRKALPAPPAEVASVSGYAPPRTETETLLAGIWAEVLGLSRVGIHDNYFALGGDSILSIQIVARATQAGCRIAPRQLFQHQTVAELAAVAGTLEAVEAEQGVVTGEAPLAPIQAWFLASDRPDRHWFNQSFLLGIDRAVEPAAVERAVARLVEHHDALRLRFHQGETGWVQELAPFVATPFVAIDLADLPETERRAALEARCAALQSSLDLEAGPILRAALFDLGEGEPRRLLLAIHHLAVDGVSWRILLEDLERLLSGRELPAKTTSWKAWTEKLVTWAPTLEGEAGYWLDRPEISFQLPIETAGENLVSGAKSVAISFDPDETRRLLEAPSAYRAQIQDLLLTALQATLGGDLPLAIELEGHGREEDLLPGVDLTRTVGWFTDLYPVVLEMPAGAGLGERLQSIKERLHTIPSRGLSHGLLRWLGRPEIARKLAAFPHPEVSFNYLGQADSSARGAGPAAAESVLSFARENPGPTLSPRATRSHELAVSAVIAGGSLRVELIYGSERLAKATVEAWAADFRAQALALAEHCAAPEVFGYTPSDFPLARLDAAGLTAAVGTTRGIVDLYPLSPLQEGLLFLAAQAPRSSAYFEQLGTEILGPLDERAFAAAWGEIVAAHPILRTSLRWRGLERPLQAVHDEIPESLLVEDWSGTAESEIEVRERAFLAADRARGFALDRPPLARAFVARLGAERRFFVLSFHHVLLDGWSFPLLTGDLFTAYGALARGERPAPPRRRPYRDYIAWLGQQDVERSERFFRAELAGIEAPTPIVVARPRPANPTEESEAVGEIEGSLGREASGALQEFARSGKLTLNTLVQGAWSVLLARTAGVAEVVYGTTVSGRPAEIDGIEGMVGLFINTLPVRATVHADSLLNPWLAAFQERLTELRDVEYTSLVSIRRWSSVPGHLPLFESLLIFENAPRGEAVEESAGMGAENAPGSAGGLRLAALRFFEQTSYPLTAVAAPGRELGLRVSYDPSRVAPEAAWRLFGWWKTLLSSLPAEGAARRLGDLALLSPEERAQLLAAGVGPRVATAPALVYLGIAAQAARTPSAVAVVASGEELTYSDLTARANRLAWALAGLGVGIEARVGIAVERSLALPVAILGVLQAGAAYVPLDPAYPAERLAYMAADAGLTALVVSPELIERFAPFAPALIALGASGEIEMAGAAENPAPFRSGVGERNLAYTIYTSGSTGRPKGVELSHGALANFLAAMIERPGIAASDVMVSVTSLSFDIAGLELYAPLLVGARMVIARRDEVADGRRLADLLEASGATVLQATPSGWRVLLASGWAGRPGLKGLVGGEALPPALAAELAGKVDSLWNMYGPTETAVWSTLDRVEDGPVAIGRAIEETLLYVVDPEGEIQPAGVSGELWIGGAGVARGYHSRPDLTAERFLPDGLAGRPGARLYRTGDLARWLPDGRLECLGRIDSQVKVRGHRIELGEIEAVLGRHPAIVAAAVTVLGEGEKRRIAAYVVPRSGGAIDGPADGVALREVLAPFVLEHLPESMLPSVFVRLEELPLTPNGKVDKKALPAPGIDLGAAATPPRTPLERQIAEIWESLLGVSGVGVESHFFSLGGHSLLAMRLASRLREDFALELPLDAIFAAPTLGAFSGRVEAALEDSGAVGEPPLVAVPRGAPLPLSFAQTRLWLLDRLTPGNPFYNLGGVQRLPGRLRIDRLIAAIDEVVDRHESLRTSFGEVDRTPVQAIHRGMRVPLRQIDLSALAAREDVARRLAARQAALPFDLSLAPLLRLWLVRLGEGDQALLYTMHHIISDGWSMGLLVAEIAACYRALEAGVVADLAPLPIQYADFAVWQRAWFDGGELERQLGYWTERLADLTGTELPADRPRPPVSTYRGRRFETALGDELGLAIAALARDSRASSFMVLLAGFEALVARLSGQDEVVLGTPIANRRRREVEGLIGFFVNTLVLRTDLSGDPSFALAIERTKETALGAFAHQDLPFERLVEELAPRRDLSRNPLFQLMFNLINTPREATAGVGGGTGQGVDRSLGAEGATALFDLQLYLIETAGSFRLHWECATDLFEEATIGRLARAYPTLLEGAVALPAARLSDLPILSAEERGELIAAGRGPAATGERGWVHEGVAAQAARTPNAVAVVADGEEMTYADLIARAGRLARRLRAAGVGVEARVGLAIERNLALPVATLGVLQAGACYVPLDPAYPADRVAYMADDAGLAAVVVSAGLDARFASYAPLAIEIAASGEIAASDEIAESAWSPPEVSAQNLAYTLYTSGSTGRPKGVEVSHGAFWNLQQTLRERPGIAAGDVLVSVTSLSFDIAGFELFGPLLVGGRTVIAKREQAVVGELLGALLDQSGATILQATPSGWRLLLASGWVGRPGLKALAGGEALAPSLVAELRGKVASLWNGYGPTETAVYSTFSEVFADERITIGRAVGGTATYVVDRDGGLLPIGVPGELRIGGAGVARGYRGRPDLTAERFLPDPWSPAAGARLYRTGDLVRRLAGGDLDYLGRIDNQVKVRGFRIELGEVEAVLAGHPAVRQAVVVARPFGDASGAEHELVAYFVERAAETEEAPDAAAAADRKTALRAYLKERLPDSMVPSQLVALAVLPTTPNGKVDRRALPDPARPARGGAAANLPGSAMERRVAEVWSEVLRLDSVSLDDSFFDLGGHSLAALKVQARLEEALGRKVPFITLFQHPTLRELAAALSGAVPAAASGSSSVLVPIQTTGTKPPLFVVHPVGGTVFFYRELARALGPDQPVWGLQSRGLQNDGEPIDDLAAMASFYLEAIAPLRTGAPVHLAGASMGGTVVYEMARQLADRGEPVGLVALFDTPGWGQIVERDSRAGTHQLVQMLTQGRFQVRTEDLEGLDPEQQVDRIWQEAQARGIPTEGVTRESLGAFRRVIEANLDAMATYPERPYEGSLVFCRAEERTQGEVANPELPWIEAARGGVDLHVVPGDHLSMLRAPNVTRIAEILARRMGE